MNCPKCGIDPDKTTSRRCSCPTTLVLCSCGQYVKEGEYHYHIDNRDTNDNQFRKI